MGTPQRSWRDAYRLNKSSRQRHVPTFPFTPGIPKIIHQTYHAPPWPEELHANVARLKATNPAWEHRFHDYDARREFIGEVYGEDVLALYDSIDPMYGAAKADVFRYLLLYKQGGLYLDMKSSTERDLDEVVRADDSYLLATWRNDKHDEWLGWGQHPELSAFPYGELQQWHIAAAPGHPFLKAVIEVVLTNLQKYLSGLHGTGAHAVWRVTGPIAYTLAIEPMRAQHPHRVVDSKYEMGLVYSVFDSDTSRTHEKLFPHYASLKSSLVQERFGRASVSAALRSARSMARRARRVVAGRRTGQR
jgi:mannosyltransferase OCH1-like enzyme